MDAKITKQRLNTMLSYDWLKIVGLALAVILLWTIILSSTATNIMASQQFGVISHYGNSLLPDSFRTAYANAFDDKVFSYEVIETTFTDLTDAGNYAAEYMERDIAIASADLIFIPNAGDMNYSEEDEESGQITFTQTYLQSYMNTYITYMAQLDGEDGYFHKMENYLLRFYTDVNDPTTLNPETVETAFRARNKQRKDKRYKKDSQFQKGLANELVRIEQYRAAYVEFQSYLAKGYVTLVDVRAESALTGQVWEGKYAVNLCPDVTTMGGLQNLIQYPKLSQDEQGNVTFAASAENMCVAFFDLPETHPDFLYEGLLYVNHLVRTYLTEPIAG